MTLILIKYLPGSKVKLSPNWDFEDDIPSEEIDLDSGLVTAISLIDPNDLDKGIEYTVKFGDWELQNVTEEYLVKERGYGQENGG